MALLTMVIRKIIKNGWIMGSFFMGLLISIALISSIPVYTDGILQRMIIREMEDYQVTSNAFPSRLSASVVFTDDMKPEERIQKFQTVDPYMNKTAPAMMNIPYLAKVETLSLDTQTMDYKNPDQKRYDQKQYAKIQALSDLKDHIKITDGRMFSNKKVNGAYEAIVPDYALTKMNMVLNTPFILSDQTDTGQPPIEIIPVGTFTVKDERDLYWFHTPDFFSQSFLIDYDLFTKDFANPKSFRLKGLSWYYAFDYHKFNVNNISQAIWAQDKIKRTLGGDFSVAYIDAPAQAILTKLSGSEKQLRTMLWALYVPILIMLFFYLFMVSRLIVDRQRNEISVLRSRGASRMQIVTDYFIEGLLLGSLAFIIGPRLALILGKVLGASSGFLEFVQRKAVNISLNEIAYIYAALGVGVCIITILIPAYAATGTTIVAHKRNISRGAGMSLWEKFFLDVLVLAVAIYGLYNFQIRQANLAASTVDATKIQVDPILFFIPALFTLGCGLIFLRIYPYILRLIFWIGKRLWPPSVYAILMEVSRSARQYQFIMLFLIMSLATGLFGANAARTINQNALERISYTDGADIAMTTYWESDASSTISGPEGQAASDQASSSGSGDSETPEPKKVQYKEPPFSTFTNLKGVDKAARVYIQNKGDLGVGGKNYSGVEIMGINPYEFGQVAWYRNGLLPHHINEYLNLIAGEPSAVLISRSLSKAAGIKVGDYIQLGWSNFEDAGFTVYGIVDYWPGWNPNPPPNAKPEDAPTLVVGNLEYIQEHVGLEPYQVWMKLKKNTSMADFYASLQKSDIQVASMKNAPQDIIKAKTAPAQLVINGGLTLGFVIAMIICFIGFLLYWILSLRGKTLEFGILRAMGISREQLISMIGIEQFLTSGIAIVMGIIIGNVTSKYYVPLFQITTNAADQVPPFRVISNASDLAKIYGWVGVMLLLSFIILGYMAAKIKIAQAVRLGED